MDRTKLKQAIEFAKKNPDSDYANELRKRIESGQIVIEPEKQNYLERVAGQYSNIGERTTEALKESGKGYIEKAEKGDVLGATGELLRSGLRSVGAVAEGAFAPITEAPVIKEALNFVGEKIGNTEIGQRLAKKIQENPETAQDVMDIVNTLTLGGGKAVEQPIKIGAEKAITTGKQTLKTGIDTLKTKEAVKTASQVDDLVGKITQGLEKDIPKAKKALSDIDTSNIKSYKDLSNTLNDKVSTLSTKLDDILGQNTKKIGLNDANNIIKVGEKSVKHNFIKDALTQLDDYFTKINDIKGKENINQLKNKFSTEGVTVKDINDLARLHGEKMNSYNANGELASGLTKQGAENTRAGLKSTARDLFGDKVYKEIDSEISNVIRTRDLVDNVSKKVTQLQQKINERGFGEKAGRLIFQVADKFTGGGLKGFVQSFVPRGEGLKIMNALDLERSLNKNLKLLDKAMNSKTESAAIKALEGILDYIENPKMGLSLEDVSKKSKGTIPENSLISEAKKYKTTINLQDKNDIDYLRRIFGEDTISDIKAGKKTNWRGESYEDIARVNIISETPKTIEQQLAGKIKEVKLKSDIFYHGTNSENAKSIMKTGFKSGSDLPENTFRGGGYGKMQGSISLAETPKEASIFSSLSKNGEIVEVKLKNNAKVVSIDGVEDATELEDYIKYLKKEKIDAVYIGGGEKELAIINPKAITPTKSQLTDIWNKANKK